MENSYWESLFTTLSDLYGMVPALPTDAPVRGALVHDERDVADGGARLNDIGERLVAIGSDFSSVAEVAAHERDLKRQRQSITARSTE